MNLVIDTDNKMCLYNSKESHKIAKLILENNNNKKYKLSYFNKHLVSFTQGKLSFFKKFRIYGYGLRKRHRYKGKIKSY